MSFFFITRNKIVSCFLVYHNSNVDFEFRISLQNLFEINLQILIFELKLPVGVGRTLNPIFEKVIRG